MYKRFRVQNFRCFRDLTLDGIGQVNLITGMNNVGKTALLEALAVHAGFASPQVVVELQQMRGSGASPAEMFDIWSWVFYGRQTDTPAVLASEDADGVRRSVTISAEPAREFAAPAAPRAPTGGLSTALLPMDVLLKYEDSNGHAGESAFMIGPTSSGVKPWREPQSPRTAFISTTAASATEEADLVSRAIEAGDDAYLAESLRLVDPRIQRVFPLVKGGAPVLYVEVPGGPPMPLALLGEGCRRLLTIALRMRLHRVVLVDEVENGIFHSSLEPMWRWIGRLAENQGAQVFCTTHSYECIQAAANALDTYDARLFRLERRGEEVVVVSADGEALKAAADHGLELR